MLQGNRSMASVMRYSSLLLVMVILAANVIQEATSARLNEDLKILERHEHWMAKHGKVYKNHEEKEARFKIFKHNLKLIHKHNKAENRTFKMRVNHFADLTNEEFVAIYASGYKKPSSKHLDGYYPYDPYNPPYNPYYPPYNPYYPPYNPYTPYTPDTPDTPYNPYTPDTPYNPYTPYTPYTPDTPYTPYTPDTPDSPYNPYTPDSPDAPYNPYNPQPTTNFRYENVSVADLPPSLDWREKGAVTPVKNQNQCGYCALFSAAAAIEGINQIKTGKLISLSEQQLGDCMAVSCDIGSVPEKAFDYVAKSGGIATESEYPYNGHPGTCQSSPAAAKITGYENVPVNDEVSLLKAVANQPVSVGIDGSTLQFYDHGIYRNVPSNEVVPSIPKKVLNHAVVVVGYGTAENGMKYWLLKNSWGTKHGENGYFRIERDGGISEGTLGVAMDASYPVI